jgi:hypothetical protein
MTDEKIEPLCENCDPALADFLQQMADQNAKVATCPRCGKIHEITPSQSVQPTAEGVRKNPQ